MGLAGRFSTFFFFFLGHGPASCSVFFSWCDTSFALIIIIILGLARREYFFKHFFDMIFLFLINLGDFFFGCVATFLF